MSEYVDDDHLKQVDAKLHQEALANAQRKQHERIGKHVLTKTRAYGKLKWIHQQKKQYLLVNLKLLWEFHYQVMKQV
jgi:hypothetical protein